MAVRSTRRTRGPLLAGIACLLCCSSAVRPVLAGETPAVGSTLTSVRLSSGTRHVPPRLSPAGLAAPGGDARASEPTAKAAHQVGRPPRSPKAKLPEGVVGSEPSAATRRLVTRGSADAE